MDSYWDEGRHAQRKEDMYPWYSCEQENLWQIVLMRLVVEYWHLWNDSGQDN